MTEFIYTDQSRMLYAFNTTQAEYPQVAILPLPHGGYDIVAETPELREEVMRQIIHHYWQAPTSDFVDT